MISNKVTKEIVSKAEIEKASIEKEIKVRKKRDFFLFPLRASSRVVAQSLLICGWPAVTVTPLPAPAVATLYLFHPVQLGIRNNRKACRKCETVFFPTTALWFSGCSWVQVFFAFKRDDRESARWKRTKESQGRVTRVTGKEKDGDSRRGWGRSETSALVLKGK